MMHIPALRKRGENEVVLWDTATDTNYVRLSHARKQKFPWRMETAVVSTMGGRVETRTLPIYECKKKNLAGITKVFHAMKCFVLSLGNSERNYSLVSLVLRLLV